MSEIELTLCRFCGSTNIEVGNVSYPFSKKFCCWCADCDAEGPHSESPEEAAEKWNAPGPIENNLRARVAELEFIIEDYREGNKKVLDDKCPSDERHCGCVPTLRDEINRLKTEIDSERMEKAYYQNALVLITTFTDGSFMRKVAQDALDKWTQDNLDAVRYWVNKCNEFEEEIKHHRARVDELTAARISLILQLADIKNFMQEAGVLAMYELSVGKK